MASPSPIKGMMTFRSRPIPLAAPGGSRTERTALSTGRRPCRRGANWAAYTRLLVPIGLPFCASCNSANINPIESIALDFRLSLCTLLLLGISGVFSGGAEDQPWRASSSVEQWVPCLVTAFGAGTLVSPSPDLPGQSAFSLCCFVSETASELPFLPLWVP